MALERLLVVRALVAEALAAGRPRVFSDHEFGLEVVAELVAEMPEHRPVGLPQLQASLLAAGIV